MADPFIAEIRAFAFGVVPEGWAQCNGQLLRVHENRALFSVLGTRFGGDGTTTFALPDLQGRVPVCVQNADDLGTRGGEAAHLLTWSEMPRHTHEALGSSSGTSGVAAGRVWGSAGSNEAYQRAVQPDRMMAPDALSVSGGSEPHLNMQPFLTLNYCIALRGIYPSRS